MANPPSDFIVFIRPIYNPHFAIKQSTYLVDVDFVQIARTGQQGRTLPMAERNLLARKHPGVRIVVGHEDDKLCGTGYAWRKGSEKR